MAGGGYQRPYALPSRGDCGEIEYKILAGEGWQWIERESWDEDTYIVLNPYSNTLAGAHTLTLCRIFLKFPD